MKLFLFVLLPLFINSVMEQQKDNSVTEETVAVRIETIYGNIDIKLYNETPLHRDNFVKLINEGFYEDLLFHRVINNFMIQGGDPDSRNAGKYDRLGAGGPGYTIPAEIKEGLFHRKGAIAAARQGDNTNPHRESSGSQFYIVHGSVFSKEQLVNLESQINNQLKQSFHSQVLEAPFKFSDEQNETYTTIGGTPHLDGSYTVFGEVIEGLDVIDQIASRETGNADRPLSDIKMNVRILTD
jgi:cyclophilin family peptidyl-prolyl cis-trans isomerase